MVRLQGDFAKPPEKRLNYKNCLDGLYRVRYPFLFLRFVHADDWADGKRRRGILIGPWGRSECLPCHSHERFSTCLVSNTY